MRASVCDGALAFAAAQPNEFVESTLSLKRICHLDRRGHGPYGPPKWMKNRCCGLPRTCHLDRSEAEWRDLRFLFRLRQCVVRQSVPGFSTSQLLTTATYAALFKERRTNFTDHTNLDRKSGGAQWRDLRFFHGLQHSRTSCCSPACLFDAQPQQLKFSVVTFQLFLNLGRSAAQQA